MAFRGGLIGLMAVAAGSSVAVAGGGDIVFGPGDSALYNGTDAAVFSGIASTFDAGDGTYGFQTTRANAHDWAAFENTGQFLFNQGGFNFDVVNTGLFNGGEGETIAAMDALNRNEGDWIVRFERTTSTTGYVSLRYQNEDEQFYLHSADGGISIGQRVNISFDYGADGVSLFVDGVLADSSTGTADFTQNTNALILGTANWTAAPGSFTPSVTTLASSLEIYSIGVIPAPGAMGVLALGGLLGVRRRR